MRLCPDGRKQGYLATKNDVLGAEAFVHKSCEHGAGGCAVSIADYSKSKRHQIFGQKNGRIPTYDDLTVMKLNYNWQLRKIKGQMLLTSNQKAPALVWVLQIHHQYRKYPHISLSNVKNEICHLFFTKNL